MPDDDSILPHAMSFPDHRTLVEDALRRFPLSQHTETEIVGKIMREQGGKANPLTLRGEIRRQAKD